jgi:hypothetical protein
MTPMTAEWVRKAEGDFDVVSLLLRSRKRSRYETRFASNRSHDHPSFHVKTTFPL